MSVENRDYENEVFVQESETGTAVNDKGTLGSVDFKAVTSDEQMARETSKSNTCIVQDASTMTSLDESTLSTELNRLEKLGSGMKLVNVSEEQRALMEQLVRGHSNFEFAVEKDTTVSLTQSSESDAPTSESVTEMAA